jgi:hypothetical protein
MTLNSWLNVQLSTRSQSTLSKSILTHSNMGAHLMEVAESVSSVLSSFTAVLETSESAHSSLETLSDLDHE